MAAGFLMVAVSLAGCQTGTQTPQPKTYDVKRTVVDTDTKKPSIKLDHEDIPGLMTSMRMEFDVAAPQVLDGVKAGDKVVGKLKVESRHQTITALDRVP